MLTLQIASARSAGFADQLADVIKPIEEQLSQVFYSIFSKLDVSPSRLSAFHQLLTFSPTT
jgi:hypothetical protein